ncbi:MAG: hypothetical protein DRG25_00610 [Deltaproteobacteria bacterium]|nr:MAG: hypothetical protein DRG25_00610 [Deltaproteobacteria bacterium]
MERDIKQAVKMNESLKTSSTKRFLFFISIFLIATDLSILLNIPIFRQVLGFTFFTIIPGLIILYILKLDKLGLTEKIVLSVGLSISFLMFTGLLINWIYPVFGCVTPLSTNSLIISLSLILLIMTLFAYLRSRTTSFTNLNDLNLNTKEKVFLLLPVFFPLLSIVGMHIMNTRDDNIMLMTLLFLIPAHAIFIVAKHDQVSDKVYPPIILLTSISLVLLLGLRSNHIIGADIHTEYYLFQQTFRSGKWQIFINTPLDACLSISILPTIYQSFLNIDSEYLFKVLYPTLVSILPLVVYLISKKYMNNPYAFLASLFFMAQDFFLWAAYCPRTILAILFFALSIMVLIHDDLTDFNKKILFVIFAASCIVSHYSTTYIFFFVLLLTWLGMRIIPRIIAARRKLIVPATSQGSDPPNEGREFAPYPRLRTHITIGNVALFFAMLFLWYSQVTGVAFNCGVNFITTTLRSLQEFFILESRGSGVASAFGVGLATKTIPQQITFVFSWLTIAFIAIGVLSTLFKCRHWVAFSAERGGKASEFLVQKFDAEFFSFSLACSAILVASVALPNVFKGYAMDRTWCQMMVVLSPFFVLGGIIVARFLRIRWTYLAILIVLVPYFMCNTGTMYQLFGVPRAITLNSEGQEYDILFVHEQETYAAKWLKGYADNRNKIYADYYGGSRLISQGGIRHSVYPRAFIEEGKPLEEGYIYLRYCGVVDGKLMDRNYVWHDITDYKDEFAKRELIYNNGGSEIWK